MEFEWDETKAAANLTKHGVPFEYATRVFLDPYRLEEQDVVEYEGEVRHCVLGMVDDRVLFVVYTERFPRMRIISARRATRHERRKYHEI
jgi:uncharacterized DUF497 family protein